MKQIRVIYQVFFFALFVFLLIAMDLTYMKGYPVRWFLEIDPLVALATSLSTTSLYHGLMWSLPIVAITVLFGRVFCGWVCPLGTLHHFFGVWFDARAAKEKIESNQFRSLYNLKYYILIALLVAALGGSLQTGWLDPIPFVTRGFAAAVQPASQGLRANSGVGVATQSAAMFALTLLAAWGLGWGMSRWLSGERRRGNPARDGILAALLAAGVLALVRFSPVEARRFHWGFWIAALLVLTLALNRWIPRLWCRALCPLGALLGLISKYSLWQIDRAPQTCSGCALCVADCQGACDPHSLLRKSECLVCMNCRDVCPEASIAYGLMPPVAREKRPSPDLSRRRLLGAVSLGALWVLGAKAGGRGERLGRRDLIRPPGSAPEPEFLERCVKCGACMKVCPTNVIQPALGEGGVEGLWSPILIFKIGACELDCVLCGQVCPTGAIRRFTRDEKRGCGEWDGRPIRLGTAFIDRGRCLPWAMDKPCVVCQEVCPVSPKAIYTKPTETVRRDGSKAVLGLPYVDPGLCTGCGICEKECPVHDERAVRVTSVGETRSLENQMLLK